MKIFVCIKHVPDTAATIKLAGSTDYEDKDVKFVMNPYDEFAVEEAVQLAEKTGGEAVILTVGPADAVATLRSALAMGAHRGILVKAEDRFLDSSVAAKALKAAMDQDGAGDIIFTGKGSVDTEGFQTQYRLSRALGVPVVNEVTALEIADGKAVAQREIGGGNKEVVEISLPGIIAGSLLVFIPATGEFVIPDLLGGGNVLMIGRLLYNEFNANHDWPVASAVAIVLLLVLVVPMMIYQHYQSRESEA